MEQHISHTETLKTAQTEKMESYYRFHSKIYDATRWTFLFGRKSIFKQLRIPILCNKTLLEIGCGTGHNLKYLLDEHPNLHIIGVDASKDMIDITKKKLFGHKKQVECHQMEYGQGKSISKFEKRPDYILLSYALTMINPNYEQVVQQAYEDLPKGGRIAVVDFHKTPSALFRHWMQKNHVRMDGHLLPVLKSKFETRWAKVHSGYFGLWTYFLFVGIKR